MADLVLGHDTTFFEKRGEPTAFERECKLGSPFMKNNMLYLPAPSMISFLVASAAGATVV